MGAKKIIMILVVAVIIAVGVGSYSYATVKADTLESSTAKVTSSNTTTNTNTTTTTNANNYTTTNNEGNNTTKQTSQNSDNTSTVLATKDNSTANVNNSYTESSSKTVNKELKNNNTSNVSSSSTQKTSNTTEGNKKVDMYEYIATDYAYAYVRSEPSNTSTVLAQLVSQTKVYVYSESSDWAYIDYQGITGYINSWELQTTQVADSNCGGDGILVYRTGYIPLSVNGAVDAMSKANANSSIVTKLYSGDSFYVEMEGDGWASISVGSEQGFIPTSDITYTNPN